MPPGIPWRCAQGWCCAASHSLENFAADAAKFGGSPMPLCEYVRWPMRHKVILFRQSLAFKLPTCFLGFPLCWGNAWMHYNSLYCSWRVDASPSLLIPKSLTVVGVPAWRLGERNEEKARRSRLKVQLALLSVSFSPNFEKISDPCNDKTFLQTLWTSSSEHSTPPRLPGFRDQIHLLHLSLITSYLSRFFLRGEFSSTHCMHLESSDFRFSRVC